MSSGYRDGAFALGLTTGVGLALNLFLWLDYQAQNKCRSDPKGCQTQENSQIGTVWDGVIGTFIIPSDTLAQWIMAFFTIAATVVLVLTLRSANKTNMAAIDAAKAAEDTNALIRQEQRPWIKLERDLTCEVNDLGHSLTLTWNYNLRNVGAKPAFDVSVHWKPIKRKHAAISQSAAKAFADTVVGETDIFRTPIIYPSETTDFLKYRGSGTIAYLPGKVSPGDGDPIVIICISYKLDPAGSEHGYDAFFVGFRNDDPAQGPFMTKMLDYTWSRSIG